MTRSQQRYTNEGDLISKQLTDILLDLLRQRKEAKLREGWKELPEWVFIS